MISQIQIINRALIKLGQNSITSITENTTTAKTMSSIYDLTRKSLLRAYTWHFSITKADLAAIAGETSQDYSYVYRLPSDCIRLIKVHDVPSISETSAYMIRNNCILTNIESPIHIEYIEDCTTEALFDPNFSVVLANLLASEACNRITQNLKLKQTLDFDTQVSLGVAKRSNAIESVSHLSEETTWITSRY